MTTRSFIIVAGTLISLCLQAQDKPSLSLEHCRQQAVLKYPTYHQYDLLASSNDLELKNLGKTWLPELNIDGQASYQSDVTKVPTIIPEFAPPAISKDWYKAYLDVSQVIWDGGATKQGKSLKNIDHDIDVRNLDIELYKIKQQVDNLFFSILLLQENRDLMQNHADEISSKLKDLESAIRNGMVLASNADILKAELLKVQQNIDEINIAEEAAKRSLSILIGEEISPEMVLEMPAPDVVLPATGEKRLEFGLFDLQQNKMEVMKKMNGTNLMPRFQAFGQAGIGRPAFDMLSNNFDDYYIIGLRLHWNFWDWNRTRNEKSVLDLNQEIVASRRDAFDRNLSIDMENKRSEITKYDQLIQRDQEILDLRIKVVKEYASRLQNGVITATEYLTELNAESEARLNINIHKIQLVQAKYDYLATIGQL